MRRKTNDPEPNEISSSMPETELSALVSRMSCSYAHSTVYEDSPLARAMFQRVEGHRQSLNASARALGINPGDGAYLLAGLRQDVAIDLAMMFLAGVTPGKTDRATRPK